MPLQPGDRRISLTIDPSGFINPDVNVQKTSDPIYLNELARISDVLGQEIYTGVVFVGNVLPIDYFTDGSGNIVAGYIEAPFNTLNAAYVAASSRFGTPTATSRVLIICMGANTTEIQSIQVCSSYVDIVGVGTNTINAPTNLPLFISCTGGGNLVNNLTLAGNGAPLVSVTAGTPIPGAMIFKNCNISVKAGNLPTNGDQQGVINIKADCGSPFVFKDCTVTLYDRPLVYYDPGTSTSSYIVRLDDTFVDVENVSNSVFLGLSYITGEIFNSTISLAVDSALFSTYVTNGASTSLINGLAVKNKNPLNNQNLKMVSATRYNTVDWRGIKSTADVTIGVSQFTDATFAGKIDSCQFNNFILNNVVINLDNLAITNCNGDFKFTVASVTSNVEFVNITTNSELSSVTDKTAFITSDGAVACRMFDCTIRYLLFTSVNFGIFCGVVVGGQSKGILRVASLANPLRQCVLRNHTLAKQPFITNGVVTSIYYPDLLIAGQVSNDIDYPIIIQGVQSNGIIDAEVADFSTIPNRSAQISNSTFTARAGINQPYFPTITSTYNTAADSRISISGSARFPVEELSQQATGIRSTEYVQQISNRFGTLVLGDNSQTTIIAGSNFFVTNPAGLREALNVNYVALYTRIPGGVQYLDIVNTNFVPWTVLTMDLEAGLDEEHASAIVPFLPFTYAYTATNTLRLSLSQPILAVDYCDIIIRLLNSDEESSNPPPISALNVIQGGTLSLLQGMTSADVIFQPPFATVPGVIITPSIPNGGADLDCDVIHSSITSTGFHIVIKNSGGVPSAGYYITWQAAATN